MKNRIKELREQKNINQICLALNVGCSQNTISKIELGTTEPRADLLVALAKYFNVSIDYLLYNTKYKYIPEIYYASKDIRDEYFLFFKHFKNLSVEDKKIICDLTERLATNASDY